KVAEAVRETAACLNPARRPFTIVGIETFRFKVQREVRQLAERIGAPVTTDVLAKGAFPMDHPLHMGVHMGPLSARPIVQRVDRADLVLNLGTLLTDMNLGSAPPQITRDRSIWAVGGRVNVSFHTYTDVQIRDFLRGLLRARLKKHRERVRYCDNLPPPSKETTRRLRVTDVLHEVNRFLRGRRVYLVVAESGDMLYARLAEDWGGRGFRVTRVDQLRAALTEAARIRSFVVIEALVNPEDLSPVSRKYIEASARHGRIAAA